MLSLEVPMTVFGEWEMRSELAAIREAERRREWAEHRETMRTSDPWNDPVPVSEDDHESVESS